MKNQPFTRRTSGAILCAVIGFISGALLGVLGLAIENQNTTEHGASYPSHRFEFLALPALPGMLIEEYRFGSDFQLGEIQFHRAPVIAWNAAFYATLLSSGFLLTKRPKRKPHPNP